MIDKIIPVFKPPGFSTYDLIRIFKKKTGFEGKIGHGGTLDPFAIGLVLLLLGEATKKFEEIKKWEKVYLAGLRLGAFSSTGDIEGKINILREKLDLRKEKIEKVLKSFEGEIEQKVPLFSAVKFKGKPLYVLAKKGEKIPLKKKKVKIFKIELICFKWPFLTIRVFCSGGVYIRQLSQDIGEKLKCGAFLYFLLREKIGSFHLKETISIENFTSDLLEKF